MRIAVATLNPWTVPWLPMMIDLAVPLPLAGRLKFNNYRKGDWKLLLPMVLLQPCLYFLLEANALRFTTSSEAGVIFSSVPLFVTLGTLLSEPVRRSTLAGLRLSRAGVATLTLAGEDGATASNPLLGNSLELLAITFAAANMVVVKRLSSRFDPWSLTAMQVAAGGAFFLPGLLFLVESPPLQWRPQLPGSLLFLGAFVTPGRSVSTTGE